MTPTFFGNKFSKKAEKIKEEKREFNKNQMKRSSNKKLSVAQLAIGKHTKCSPKNYFVNSN
jgi:hypothetical protein